VKDVAKLAFIRILVNTVTASLLRVIFLDLVLLVFQSSKENCAPIAPIDVEKINEEGAHFA